ncbi:MAG: hypothetical protein P8182_08650, partial [Deltaproteobacteria bacterium]
GFFTPTIGNPGNRIAGGGGRFVSKYLTPTIGSEVFQSHETLHRSGSCAYPGDEIPDALRWLAQARHTYCTGNVKSDTPPGKSSRIESE